MTKLKSALITTLYHGVAFLCIWLMLMIAYIGMNTILPESIYNSENVFIQLSYSLCKALVSIVAFVVMAYPIANWITDIYGVYISELHTIGNWIFNTVKTFVSGGLHAISNTDKDTL